MTSTTAPDGREELVHLETIDRVAVLTLDSPANRNALSRRLVADLGAHLASAAADASLHSVLIRSSHRVFCSGADLREAQSVDMAETAASLIALQRAIAALPVPVVVRLDGPVRAGGLGIVASADIVVCRDDVTFALTEVKLGLAAAVISIPLLHRLPTRVAADWFLTGRQVGALEAREGGLVTHVAAEGDLDGTVEEVLGELRTATRQGLTEAKALLARPLLAAFDADGVAMAELSGRLFHSEVAQQAMARVVGRS